MRRVWKNLDEVEKGSKVLGIRVRQPQLIICNKESDKEVFYSDDKEVAIYEEGWMFIEITEEERLQCVDQGKINELGTRIAKETLEEMKVKHYKVMSG
jgi:hypothetical protein